MASPSVSTAARTVSSVTFSSAGSAASRAVLVSRPALLLSVVTIVPSGCTSLTFSCPPRKSVCHASASCTSPRMPSDRGGSLALAFSATCTPPLSLASSFRYTSKSSSTSPSAAAPASHARSSRSPRARSVVVLWSRMCSSRARRLWATSLLARASANSLASALPGAAFSACAVSHVSARVPVHRIRYSQPPKHLGARLAASTLAYRHLVSPARTPPASAAAASSRGRPCCVTCARHCRTCSVSAREASSVSSAS